MNKLLIPLLLLCVGCDDRHEYEVDKETVVVIDGCEYLKIHVPSSYSYSHKGNCTNAIHGHFQ